MPTRIFGPEKEEELGAWKNNKNRNSINWTVHLILSGELNQGKLDDRDMGHALKK
jgi:hypothetical protein